MRFTAFFTLMAAGSAMASLQPGEEETTTTTATSTRFITITKCADTYPDCPANQPSTTEVPVEATPTPEPEPSYEPEPTPEPVSEPEPVPEPETSSEIIIAETSSALPELPEPSSSAYYPISNATTHVGPTASAPQTTLTQTVPVVTSLETEVVEPSAPAAEESSAIPESGAAGVTFQGGLLAGMVAVGIAALF